MTKHNPIYIYILYYLDYNYSCLAGPIATKFLQSCLKYSNYKIIQCGNLAREGLRTLVIAKKILTEQQYASFEVRNSSNGIFLHV